MRAIFFKTFLITSTIYFSCNPATKIAGSSTTALFTGNFIDDYSVKYTITDSLFLQQPGVVYRILEWNKKEQYIIAQNGADNPSEKNLFTRIDYMEFSNMPPYLWGFCYTAFKAANAAEALNTSPADRQFPKKGCNGFPFSRMKRIL